MFLITGATGAAGSHVVSQLFAEGVRFRALVRNPAKSHAMRLQGIQVAPGDLERPDTIDRALQGVTKVFLLSSPHPRQVEIQGNLVKAAIRAKVQHIVKFSAYGASDDSPVSLGRMHRQTEREIESSGIPFTHLRPHSFMQNLFMFAPAIASQGILAAPMADARIATVDVRDVAAVAVKVLCEPGHEGKAYDVSGPEAISYAEMAERLSAAVGRKITYVDADPEDARRAMLGAGVPAWLADDLLVLYQTQREGKAATVSNVVPEITGRNARSFSYFARDYASEFTAARKR